MKIRVLYFGVLRELAGKDEDSQELPEGATTRQLLDRLRGGRAEGLWDRLALAVNREFALPDRVLHEGDEVALLPPVSGGAR